MSYKKPIRKVAKYVNEESGEVVSNKILIPKI